MAYTRVYPNTPVPLNDYDRRELCRLSWSSRRRTPPYSSTIFWAVFWGTWKTPYAENFHRCTHVESDSRLLFQKWSKSVQVNWPKGRVALITEKKQHVLAPWGGTPGAISPIFSCVSAHRGPSLIFQISSI